MEEIKFRLKDGEPTCDPNNCPQFVQTLLYYGVKHGECKLRDNPGRRDCTSNRTCWPGIRQQWDKFREDTQRINWIDQNMDCDLAGPGLHISLVEIEDDETLREAIDRTIQQK